MEDIQAKYNSLWEQSVKKFKDNIFELDYHLNNKEEDHRRGITIIGRFENEALVKLFDFLNECKLIEPNQYYYDKDDIHLTILSVITCFNGFSINDIDKEAYKYNKGINKRCGTITNPI